MRGGLVAPPPPPRAIFSFPSVAFSLIVVVGVVGFCHGGPASPPASAPHIPEPCSTPAQWFSLPPVPKLHPYFWSLPPSPQTVTLQEMPESAPVGQLPRSVDVRLEDDLVDKVKPGDRVRICGVYQAYTNKGQPSKGEDQSIKFATVLVGNNVIHLGKKLKEPTLTVWGWRAEG